MLSFKLEFLQKKELSLGGRPPWQLEGAGLASEDLKRAGALTPLGQKHTGWIWTGILPLIKRNALTTEPQLLILDGKIWNIAVYEVELQKKNCNTENMLECVVTVSLLANSGADSSTGDMTWGLKWNVFARSQSIIHRRISIPSWFCITAACHEYWGDILPKEVKTWTLCDDCLPSIEAILASGWC